MYRASLSGAQAKLKAEIDQIRASIPHSAEIGSSIEKCIRSALQEVLPGKIGVADGFVIDSEGRVSKQMDIVLFDKLGTPIISSNEGARVFPVETTYACGEIKTQLNASTLQDTFEKCSSYKNLSRKAYVEAEGTDLNLSGPKVNITGKLQKSYLLFGGQHNHWQSIFFCIAIKGASENTLQNSYVNIANRKQLPVEKRLDAAFALNGPCLINCQTPLQGGIPTPGSIDLLPCKGSTLVSYPAEEPWALFVHLLLRYMVQAPSELIKTTLYYDGAF